MGTYGASIPAKVFRETTATQYTRSAFATRIARALDAVGMIFLDAIAPYNILDPSNAEDNRTGGGSGPWTGNFAVNNAASIFLFDFPTTEYFELLWNLEASTRQYRPCIALVLGNNNNNDTSASVQSVNIGIHLVVRPNTNNFDLGNCYTFNRLRAAGPTSYVGLASSTTSNGGCVDLGRYLGMPNLTSWKPYSSYGGTPQSLLTVRSLCTYLGPGGLLIAAGTNSDAQDKTGLFDICNVVFPIAGERIPNRQKLSANDPELNRVCPVFQWFVKTSQTNTWYSSLNGPLSICRFVHPAVQYSSRNSVQDGQSAYCDMYSLDNLDYRSGTVATFPHSVVSPVVISGTARNILSPLVVTPGTGFTTVGPGQFGRYYNVSSDGTIGLGTWTDYYYAPSFRTSDPSLPIGEVTDPDTGIKWWGHWASDFSSSCAFKLGASYTSLSVLPTKSYGSPTTVPWDFTIPTITTGVDIPIQTGIPSITKVDYVNISGGVGLWAKNSSANTFNSTSTVGSSKSQAIQFEFDWPAGVDPSYQVEITFSAYLRGGIENNASYVLLLQFMTPNDYLQTTTLTDTASWSTLFTMQSAGTNTGNSSYNYTNRGTFRCAFGGPRNGNGRIRLRFAANCSTGGSASNDARVGDISLIFKKWN